MVRTDLVLRCVQSTREWLLPRVQRFSSLWTEITGQGHSTKGFEDAIQVGIARASKTLRHLDSAWVKEQHVEVKNGKVATYQVNMMVTFTLDD